MSRCVLRAFAISMAIAGSSMLSACGGGGGGGSGSSPAVTANAVAPGSAAGSIAGSVAVQGGAPLAGVTITLYKTNDHTYLTTTTDANGNYSFSAQQTGSPIRYELWATKAGYGFLPQAVNGGATVQRTDHNALFKTALVYSPAQGGSLTGANFAAYDGRNGQLALARTGQSTSYAPGDDGALRRGTAWPAARFTDNQDGTVTDHLTGLVWLRDAGCLGTTNWSAALSAANQLANGTCGLADGSRAGQWRLPNVGELESLVDVSRTSPALPASQPFRNVGAAYWTSTTYRGEPTNAWVIRFTDGRYLNDASSNVKDTALRGAWAVRDGDGTTPGAVKLASTGQFIVYAAGDDASAARGTMLRYVRFVDRGDGTVVDTMTGLVWLKKADCIRQPWAGAIASVAALGAGQCGLSDGSVPGDWRMPNRAEMLSLADRALGNAAQDWAMSYRDETGAADRPAVFAGFVSSEFYWTSSTDAAATTMAWTVYSCDFGVYDVDKSSAGYTMAVRGPG